jgi:23S rRNA (cytosine1962-C5)-methyltransferase
VTGKRERSRSAAKPGFPRRGERGQDRRRPRGDAVRPAPERAPSRIAGGSAAVVLNPERERSLLRGHPWVFSGAIDQVHGDPGSGATVRIVTAEGQTVGLGAYSPQSQIRVRLWTRDAASAIDGAFFRERLRAAIERRRALLGPESLAACRLVHGEADGLPGVVADRYSDVVVLQLTSAGAEHWRDAIANAIEAETGCRAVYERSDAEVRELEGLDARTGPIRGTLVETRVEIVEHGIRYRVDVARGQKTGFYLDQRDNRARVRDLSRDADVLNCFGYTGGFALAALAGGARSVVSVDSSAEALALARANLEANGFDASRAEWAEADVFQHLRQLRDAGRSFDLVVLDPPKFAPTAAHADRAARAYKDINLLAFRLLRHGGVLVTFSCSGGVSPDLFQKIVAGAAVDAGSQAQVLARLQAAPDHPVMLAFPEGEYLKGLILKRF